jgi:ABC-type multidrug transport system fused ATPase/permease subunit
MRQERPDVTVFCVSHRPTTIRRADLILVLDGGRLVASGTHEGLSRTCQEYGEFLMAEERREHVVEGHRGSA